MRNLTPLMIAAALIVSGPAAAQETNADANAAAANEVLPADANAVAVDPALANDVTAAPAPMTADPLAMDNAATAPADDDDGGGFPWGLLGLLGLLGLIPRSRRS